jgi:hypothetical protein
LALISLTHVTPSSAAVFKLWFYGTLLRSKTIKPRLKNCPVREAHDAATTCYVKVLALALTGKKKNRQLNFKLSEPSKQKP